MSSQKTIAGSSHLSFTTKCTENENGDLTLDFPDELLDAMGWSEGTELEISAVAGSIVFKEVKPSPGEKVPGNTRRKRKPKGGSETPDGTQ